MDASPIKGARMAFCAFHSGDEGMRETKYALSCGGLARGDIVMRPVFDGAPDETPSPQYALAMDEKRDGRLVDSGREKADRCFFAAGMEDEICFALW